MNWSIIFKLSLLGLVMAIATVAFVPSKVEPILWVLIFIFGAYVIAKNCNGNYFLHGFLVSLVNSFWITTAHVIFFKTYIANHPEMVEMSNKMPLSNHPRIMMLCTGPIFGALFGLVFGLFAWIASKIIKKPNPVS